jgi:hypothetical protein
VYPPRPATARCRTGRTAVRARAVPHHSPQISAYPQIWLGQLVDRCDRLDALAPGEFLGGHEVVRWPVLGMLRCGGHVVTSVVDPSSDLHGALCALCSCLAGSDARHLRTAN